MLRVKATSILKTKLVPPRIKNHILHRASLTKKLKRIAHYPLSLLHSGPGYGKSTALSSFLRDQQLPFCWYSINEYDDDLVPFLTYILSAIRTRHPSFGEDLLADLLHGERYLREEDARSFGLGLVNELTYLPEDLVLILDDFHLIEHSTAIDLWIRWFIQHLPEGFHLVLSSRTRPAWDIVTTMKVKGNLLELTEKDLAFTSEEIEVLFEDYYDYPLEPREIESIFLKTEGWVIAIQMIWQQLTAQEDLSKILRNDAQSMEDLFRYLALEVLNKQPLNMQLFLERTCIFEELTEDLCNQVLQIKDADKAIDYLLHKNLFLSSVGEKQFRYHALFKDFMQNQLSEKPEEYRQLHKLAAEYYQQKNKDNQAIFHLQAIKDYVSVAQVLQLHGREMIEQGQLENLLTTLDGIPEEVKDQFYFLWIYKGEIQRYRCMYEKAILCYQRAERLANQRQDASGESAGLEGQARIYLDTIQPKEADLLLKNSIAVLEQSDSPDGEQQIRLYSLMAENLINLGHAEDAGEWYEKSRMIRADFHEDILEARLSLRTGKLQHTRKILEKRKQEELANWSKQLPRSHRETDILLSLVHSFMGEPEKAKKSAEQGMLQGINSKAPFVEACGWIRMGHAVQLFAKYDHQLSVQCYQTALTIMEEINISRGKAEPLMGLCLLYGRERKLDQALQYGEQALLETEKVKDLWLSGFIRMCIGISYLYSNKWQEASQSLQECHAMFIKCGDNYGITVTLLWQTLLSYQQESWDSFATEIESLLTMMQKGDYAFLMQKRTMFGPRDVQRLAPLLLEAKKRNIKNSYLSQLLAQLGLENMTSHPGYTLRIKTLGEFRVWLGDKEVNEKDWQRDKAKELFQLLVTKRMHSLQKDQIFSLLWKETDEKVATRDFKVALNALNKVLEPNRAVRSTPLFIQRHETAYGLNLDSAIELDTSECERWILDGLDAKDEQQAKLYLQKGLELYTGDYLPERRHEDWCIDERERLQVLFLRGAERMAQINLSMEEFDQAIFWSEKILDKDACWEEAYRLLMQCYYQKNNRPQALKWFQKCCEKLEEEIGVKPMPATEQMYNMMMLNKKL